MAGGYDGEIRIRTLIENGDASSKVMQMVKKFDQFSSKIESSEKKANALREQLNKVGNAKVPTGEYSALNKELDLAKIKLEENLKLLKKIPGDEKNQALEEKTRRIKEEYNEILKLKEMLKLPVTMDVRGIHSQIHDAEERLKIFEGQKERIAQGKIPLNSDIYKSEAEKAKQSISEIESKMQELEKSGKAFKVNAGVDEKQKEIVDKIEKQESETDNLKAQQDQIKKAIEDEVAEERRLKELYESATVSNQRLVNLLKEEKQLESQIADMKKAGLTAGYDKYDEAVKKLSDVRAQIKEIKSENTVEQSFTGIGKAIQRVKVAVASMIPTVGKAKKATGGIINLSQKAGETFGKFIRRVKKIALTILVFQWVSKAFRALIESIKSGIQNYAKYSTQFNKKMSELKSSALNLKNSIGAAAVPIVNALAPALTVLCSWLTKAINLFNKFISALSGKKTWSRAKEQQVDYAASLDNTANAAKKAKGALQGFDELNVINSNDSGSGSGGSGGGVDYEEVPLTEKDFAWIDKVKNKIKELAESFAKGFKKSWEKLDISSQLKNITDSAKTIQSELIGIFTDPNVTSAAWNFARVLMESLGSISASVISIGATIAENFLGGLSNYLEENSGRIKQFLIDCFDISSDIATLIAEAFETIADIFSVFGDENGQQITADLIQIFADAFSFITETALKFVRDMLDILVTPISDNSESIKNTLNNLLGFIQQITGVLSDIVRQITDGLTALYDEHLKPFFDSVRDGLSEIMAEALKLWDEYIQPVLNYIAKLVTETYEQHLKPVIDNLMGLLGAVIDLIKTLWEVVLKPLIIWLMNTLAPKVSDIAKKVSGFVSAAVDIILDCISFVLKNAENLIKIVTALINGDWKGAWNAARDYVKDGANGIIKIIETMVNKIIDGINTLTNGFNSIGFDVPDFLGGGSWHPSIPTIPNVNLPRLANGGITTGSTLANIGEAGREAVLPLENNLSYMKPLAEMIASEMKGVQTVRIVADEGKIFKIVREEANDYYRRTGSPAFDF